MVQELQLFVKEALEKGSSRKEIATVLSKAGWAEEEIKASLASFADIAFPIAVPKRKPYLSAREAFLYLVLFLTLYISAFSLGSLLFQFVNRGFPDPLLPYEWSPQAIRGFLAALIVAFPIFIGVSWFMRKSIAKHPEKKASKVRKWLTYITLFIAAGVIISDLIVLVTSLLNGELTLRFVLKVLIVLVLAGLIFGYYLWDLRSDERED